MGNNLVRYKAELDFDGRELTRSYLDKHDLITMLEVLSYSSSALTENRMTFKIIEFLRFM